MAISRSQIAIFQPAPSFPTNVKGSNPCSDSSSTEYTAESPNRKKLRKAHWWQVRWYAAYSAEAGATQPSTAKSGASTAPPTNAPEAAFTPKSQCRASQVI